MLLNVKYYSIIQHKYHFHYLFQRKLLSRNIFHAPSYGRLISHVNPWQAVESRVTCTPLTLSADAFS